MVWVSLFSIQWVNNIKHKIVVEPAQKSADLHHPAHAQGPSRAFALY